MEQLACASVLPPSWGFYPALREDMRLYWSTREGGGPDEKKANQYFTRAKTSRHTHFIFLSPRTLFINGLFLESWRMLMEWNTAWPRQKVWWHSFFRAAPKKSSPPTPCVFCRDFPLPVFLFIPPFLSVYACASFGQYPWRIASCQFFCNAACSPGLSQFFHVV